MPKIKITIVLLFLSLQSIKAQNQENLIEQVFIGELVQLQAGECLTELELEPDELGLGYDTCESRLYDTTFKIHRSYYGNLEEGDNFVFKFQSYYDIPRYANSKYSLIAFEPVSRPGFYRIAGYNFDVYPTADGGFARCACDGFDMSNQPESCNEQNFNPPVMKSIADKSPFYISNLLDNEIHRIEGQLAICQKGMPADVTAVDMMDNVLD